MAKKPSAETELKRVKRDWQDAARQVIALRTELMQARGERTKAQQQAAEWRARFDALLARVPLAAMKESAGTGE